MRRNNENSPRDQICVVRCMTATAVFRESCIPSLPVVVFTGPLGFYFSGLGESSSVMFFSSFHAMAIYLCDSANRKPPQAVSRVFASCHIAISKEQQGLGGRITHFVWLPLATISSASLKNRIDVYASVLPTRPRRKQRAHDVSIWCKRKSREERDTMSIKGMTKTYIYHKSPPREWYLQFCRRS
jgi:hypothetical protein